MKDDLKPPPQKKKRQTTYVHFLQFIDSKRSIYSCSFSMVSSLYLPFSFPSARDLALRSRIFLRSLSSFSLVMTTYKEINYYWLFNKTDHSLHAEDESTTFKFYFFFWSTLHFFCAEDLSNIQHVVLYFHSFFVSIQMIQQQSHAENKPFDC